MPPLGSEVCPELLCRSDHALLSIADPCPDSRVVLFVPGALELACALFRRGVAEVTMVRVEDRHRNAEADVAIIPEVRSAGFLEHAIPCARRMLVPLSTITIRIPAAPADDLVLSARRSLALNGFSAVRTWSMDGEVLLRAELPLCGRLACA